MNYTTKKRGVKLTTSSLFPNARNKLVLSRWTSSCNLLATDSVTNPEIFFTHSLGSPIRLCTNLTLLYFSKIFAILFFILLSKISNGRGNIKQCAAVSDKSLNSPVQSCIYNNTLCNPWNTWYSPFKYIPWTRIACQVCQSHNSTSPLRRSF